MDRIKLNNYINMVILRSNWKQLFDHDNSILKSIKINRPKGRKIKEYKSVVLTKEVNDLVLTKSKIVKDEFNENKNKTEGILYIMFAGNCCETFEPLYIGIAHIYGKNNNLSSLFNSNKLPRWDFNLGTNGHIDKLNASLFKGEENGHIIEYDKNNQPKKNEKDAWSEKLFDVDIDGNIKLKREIFLYYNIWNENHDSILKHLYEIEEYKPSLHAEEQILIQIMGQYYPESLLNVIGATD